LISEVPNRKVAGLLLLVAWSLVDVAAWKRLARFDRGGFWIAAVTAAAAPGRPVAARPAQHPYTLAGRQVDVGARGAWVAVGECGLAPPALLADCAQVGPQPRRRSRTRPAR